MARERGSPEGAGEPADWSTPASRVRWLVGALDNGNRSSFAGKVGVSHTSISKVVAGKPPGRKLLTAIARNLKVSSEWLLTGKGKPFLGEAEKGDRSWVPIATALLPGPPQEHPDLVSKEWVVDCSSLFTPSQYWFRLGPREPLLRAPQRPFLEGDLLLMETARTLFPKERRLRGHLCVVRFPGGGQPLKLARVDAEEGEEGGHLGLTADTFDLSPDESELVREVVYSHHPGGKITQKEHLKRIVQVKEKKRLEPVGELELEGIPVQIAYADIVAVWTQILRRSPDMGLE